MSYGGTPPIFTIANIGGCWREMKIMNLEDEVFRDVIFNTYCKNCDAPFSEHAQRKCLSEPTYFVPNLERDPDPGGPLDVAIRTAFELMLKEKSGGTGDP